MLPDFVHETDIEHLSRPTQQTPSEETSNDFFSREAKLIQNYAKGTNISFTPGDGWAVNPETGEATFDPNFFTERGYTEAQSIFAALHETDHVVEMAQLLKTKGGKELYESRKKKKKAQQRTAILDNILKDIADNKRVLIYAPSLKSDCSELYKTKLFPNADLRENPKHLQLMYALIRQAMIPGENVQVDPRVQIALDSLRKVKGKSGNTKDLLAIVTDPSMDLATKYRLIEKYIDPVVDELYEEDKKDKDKQKSQQNDKENNGNDQPEDDQSGSDKSDPFQQEYDNYFDQNPQALSEEQQEAAVTGSQNDTAKRQEQAYEMAQGVEKKDIEEYQAEFRKIEQYIEGMNEQFRRIVAERLIPRRRLVGGKIEGALLNPALLVQAQQALDKGDDNVPVYKDFEGRNITETVPVGFEITAACDRSGSMETGGKKEEQRRAVLLLMESLREFMELPEVEEGQINPDLEMASEVWSFGGATELAELKPLSAELTDKQRVEVFKSLGNCPGASTEDYSVLGKVVDGIAAKERARPGYKERLKLGVIKKILIVFSDGVSANEAEYQRQKSALKDMGVVVVEYRKITGGVDFIQTMNGILKQALDDMLGETS